MYAVVRVIAIIVLMAISMGCLLNEGYDDVDTAANVKSFPSEVPGEETVLAEEGVLTDEEIFIFLAGDGRNGGIVSGIEDVKVDGGSVVVTLLSENEEEDIRWLRSVEIAVYLTILYTFYEFDEVGKVEVRVIKDDTLIYRAGAERDDIIALKKDDSVENEMMLKTINQGLRSGEIDSFSPEIFDRRLKELKDRYPNPFSAYLDRKNERENRMIKQEYDYFIDQFQRKELKMRMACLNDPTIDYCDLIRKPRLDRVAAVQRLLFSKMEQEVFSALEEYHPSYSREFMQKSDTGIPRVKRWR